jgi:hypothetical protein
MLSTTIYATQLKERLSLEQPFVHSSRNESHPQSAKTERREADLGERAKKQRWIGGEGIRLYEKFI